MKILYQFVSHLNSGPCMKKNRPAPPQEKNLDFHVKMWIMIFRDKLYFILYRILQLMMG